MNILFLGGAGFIGSSILRELQCYQYDGLVIVLEPPIADVKRLNKFDVTIIRGYIEDTALIETIIEQYDIGTVVHMVSTLIPGSSYKEYEIEQKKVVLPTKRLAQLCSKRDVKLIFFSSGGTVYGERISQIPFKETDVCNPICYYGHSKKEIEDNILLEHRVSGLNYLILRPSNAYGPGQRLNGKQGLIAVAMGKALKNEGIEIWGDGQNLRDYIYIDDLAKIVVSLIIKDVRNIILNIGSGIGYSINDVLSLLQKHIGKQLSIKYISKRNSDVSNMILDNTHLKTICDMELTSLDEGIHKFLSYIKEKCL